MIYHPPALMEERLTAHHYSVDWLFTFYDRSVITAWYTSVMELTDHPTVYKHALISHSLLRVNVWSECSVWTHVHRLVLIIGYMPPKPLYAHVYMQVPDQLIILGEYIPQNHIPSMHTIHSHFSHPCETHPLHSFDFIFILFCFIYFILFKIYCITQLRWTSTRWV